MEILLIGNGFDLAHGLPTKYRDFLDFCQGIEVLFSEHFAFTDDYMEKLKKVLGKDISPQVFRICELAHIFMDDSAISSNKNSCRVPSNISVIIPVLSEINNIYKLIHKNTWIHFFIRRASLIGENWIDFESEISTVIQALDLIQGLKIDNPFECGDSNIRLAANIATKIAKAAKWSSLQDTLQDKDNHPFNKHLNEELAKLIRALEIYISGFINTSTIEQKNSDIDQLHPDHVLSFNYSDTYERVYGSGKSIAYDYIHGKAELGNTKDSCNLVLGIDEYLDDEQKNTNVRFLTFKKFYQRIYKSTDSQYWNWIDEIKRNYEPSTLYIFGHSLDITDRDVLQALICCPHMQTKIYYHRKSEDDKQALGKLIHNLIRILGQEELIQRTSGANRTIEFIPQTITT